MKTTLGAIGSEESGELGGSEVEEGREKERAMVGAFPSVLHPSATLSKEQEQREQDSEIIKLRSRAI